MRVLYILVLYILIKFRRITFRYPASWSSTNAFVSGARGLRLTELRPVKSDTVLPTACHRCDISSTGGSCFDTMTRRWTAESRCTPFGTLQLVWYKIWFDLGDLSNHELDLLRYSAEGNLDGLREIFVQQSYYLFHLDVNCVDSLDRTALSLATINHHLNILEFLLSDEVRKYTTDVIGLR